ncbi:MAG: hypothetical protein WBB81_14605 [Pyrinomonadaceae bacterium]
MNDPTEIADQIANQAQVQQESIGQTVADVGGTVAGIGTELVADVAVEGAIDTAAEVAGGIGETVLGGVGDLLGGLFDAID